nr:MAG TPA: hypothetical protein [Caudoviricetes sp.]
MVTGVGKDGLPHKPARSLPPPRDKANFKKTKEFHTLKI